MVKKTSWETVTIYNIPSIENQSLSNTLTLKNIKPGIFIRGEWPFPRDVFNDKDFSPSAVTDNSIKDDKNLDIFGLSDSHTTISDLDVRSQSSTSGLNTGQSSSE
jgi:hypothetical protein